MRSTTATARVVVLFADAAAAEHARRALEPENAGALVARVEGARLVLEAGPATVGSLVATLEDAFACLVVAGGALDAADGA